MREIKLGDRIRDKHSKVEGVAIAIETHLYRETRVQIQRDGVDPNGMMWPETWLFAGRLDIVE